MATRKGSDAGTRKRKDAGTRGRGDAGKKQKAAAGSRRRTSASDGRPASQRKRAPSPVAASPRPRVAVSSPARVSLSPLVAVIMGSTSDWETMQQADEVLTGFDVPHECLVVSAHRTPQWMTEFAEGAEARGLEVIIAGAGGAAHLPGMVAAQTLLPVLGVPVESRALKGLDSLLSIVQMPAGVPVGTLAIGGSGAKNAALLAVAILGNTRPALREQLRRFREEQQQLVREAQLG
jgi:5-(carboxyamino)imidazole ribonucleotide mutase